MGSSGATRFAFGVAGRAMLIAALAFAVFEVLARTQLYATALVLAGAACVAGYDLARAIARADGALGQFLDGLAADAYERPVSVPAGFGRFIHAADRAVTRLNEARTLRQRQIDYLQGLMDTVSAALVVLDAGGTIVLANRAAQKLAGHSARRLADVAVVGPEGARRIEAMSPGMRAMVRLADGRLVLAQAAEFRPTGAPSGRLISLQNMSGELDVVEQKAWRDLVRILSHEMMNSLTPIVSLSESLKARAQADPETAEALEVIARRSAGLMAFVDRYRKVAELPQPDRRPIGLEPFAASVAGLMRATFEARGVAFEHQVEPQGLAVAADRELLEQAVINLIKNALDACAGVEAPAVSLVIRGEGERVVIAVADNGAGLDQQNLDDIFVPFFSTRPGGSGIGLSLARQIALAHGGQLEAEPRQPRGAIFRMTMPNGGTNP